MRSFDSREINIRMEYRFCPNMILIDTPGLIHAPSGKRLNAEQRSLTAVRALLGGVLWFERPNLIEGFNHGVLGGGLETG